MNLYKGHESRGFYLSLGILFASVFLLNNFFFLEHIIEETSLNILSSADLLRENFSFITGGTSHNCPILTFPDNPHTELTQEKYKKLVTYLTQVPR
jgi:hypothetical protein